MGKIAEQNRNATYYSVLSDQPKVRRDVLEAIADSGSDGITRHELADKLRRPLSSMCARVSELEDAGHVVETSRSRQTQYGGSATVVVLSPSLVVGGLVQKTLF